MTPPHATILVIDDTTTNIQLLSRFLGREGYTVLSAEDGFEGFKAAVQHHPDLVLLDVVMPDTNGYEVCELLKIEESTRDIPVIFLTGADDVEEREKGLSLGAVDFITKPFSLADVLARIQQHLQAKYSGDDVPPETC